MDAHGTCAIFKEPLGHSFIIGRLNLDIDGALDTGQTDAVECIEHKLWLGCHVGFQRTHKLGLWQDLLDKIRRAQLDDSFGSLIFLCHEG